MCLNNLPSWFYNKNMVFTQRRLDGRQLRLPAGRSVALSVGLLRQLPGAICAIRRGVLAVRHDDRVDTGLRSLLEAVAPRIDRSAATHQLASAAAGGRRLRVRLSGDDDQLLLQWQNYGRRGRRDTGARGAVECHAAGLVARSGPNAGGDLEGNWAQRIWRYMEADTGAARWWRERDECI